MVNYSILKNGQLLHFLTNGIESRCLKLVTIVKKNKNKKNVKVR